MTVPAPEPPTPDPQPFPEPTPANPDETPVEIIDPPRDQPSPGFPGGPPLPS